MLFVRSLLCSRAAPQEAAGARQQGCNQGEQGEGDKDEGDFAAKALLTNLPMP
jgi:hypothetical protein